MTPLAFDWVDAFADRPFGGNGCAVVHDAAHLDAETCRAFVRETSLVECTFTGPSERADMRVRYFLASREIPFAGHPTIATVAAMLSRGLIEGDGLTLETQAGIIPITLTRSAGLPLIGMTQVAPRFGPEVPPDLVAATIGLDPGDIVAPPQVVSTGLPFCITVLRDHDALRRARLDVDALGRFRAHLGGEPDADVMEPFLVTLEGATSAGRTFSRLLLAPPSPPEDPFTGSATGATAAYLWARGLIDAPRYTAEQGHWMGRPGQAEVEVLGPPGAIEGVRVSGTGHMLMRGELLL
ncbi:PhzF family phenazine biosynthesis protein [Limimaricola pyoseonensis]|uniref:Phenazine biosynthesis protein PhzF family n=1 Tax=Limimaricola pyoseonensis TaxID=521013 RepID=A0A1G7IBN1_9RHOB|nr:PhzF family phenazine biosynthesis protein [Limimaricola pyoseonensis]SDF10131.1 phenazine biosynthesis protein PhzF family [Limimaricola pyoseonensis]